MTASGLKVLRTLVLGTVLLWLLPNPATAQQEKSDLSGAVNEFRRAGAGLGCTTLADAPDTDPPELPCLHIGQLQVGARFSDIRSAWGEPERAVPQNDSLTAYVYVFDYEAESPAYTVLTVRSDTVVAVQLTGTAMHEDYTLSSVRLGDPEDRVLKFLGPPMMTREVPEVNGVQWGYAPWPLSLEIVDGRVYSMRVSLPAYR